MSTNFSGNKGEWSELFTFFKLVSEGKIYAGDSLLNKSSEKYYPIISILRKQNNAVYTYNIDGENVNISAGESLLKVVPRIQFAKASEILIEKIRKGEGTFTCEEAEDLMIEIGCTSIKAKYIDKSDIQLLLHDLRTGLIATRGFS